MYITTVAWLPDMLDQQYGMRERRCTHDGISNFLRALRKYHHYCLLDTGREGENIKGRIMTVSVL